MNCHNCYMSLLEFSCRKSCLPLNDLDGSLATTALQEDPAVRITMHLPLSTTVDDHLRQLGGGEVDQRILRMSRVMHPDTTSSKTPTSRGFESITGPTKWFLSESGNVLR